jgi:glutamate carboxypeptidase
MSYAHKYFPRLQAYLDEMLQRLETLVNIDSGTGQGEGINQIMHYLEAWLDELGFTVTLHHVEGFGYNLVARRAGRGRLRLLLVGHIDTVYAPGTALTHPFTVRDGCAFGPGIIDMKSAVVMCLYVLRVLQEMGFEEYGELCVVFNNDEEVGSPASAPLIREIASSIDVGLVLEPSRAADVITKARKGSDKYVLEVFGVPAHSGAEPHKGRSAVIELAHKMIAIHSLNTLFHSVTYNVTRISSSEPLNVVPDEARCHISVRAYDTHSLDVAAEMLKQVIAGSSVPDTRTVLTRKPGRKPYKATQEVMQLVTMAQMEGEAFGLEIIAEGKGGVSDANTLMEVAVPTLDSLGPVGGGMHDLNREFLRVDSLALRGAMLAGLIERICLSKFTGPEPSS